MGDQAGGRAPSAAVSRDAFRTTASTHRAGPPSAGRPDRYGGQPGSPMARAPRRRSSVRARATPRSVAADLPVTTADGGNASPAPMQYNACVCATPASEYTPWNSRRTACPRSWPRLSAPTRTASLPRNTSDRPPEIDLSPTSCTVPRLSRTFKRPSTGCSSCPQSAHPR